MNKTAMKIPKEKKNWIVLQIFCIECQNVFCDFYYLIVSYALESCSIKPGSVYIQSCRLDEVLCQSSVYDVFTCICLQAFHSDIQKHQQPILALVYQTEQLLEHHQEELTPEQVSQLQQLADNLKSNMSKVKF